MPKKLKHFYAKKEDVPAGLVDAYEERDGRWELIELDDDVPIIQNKVSLENTQRTLKEDLRKAEDRATRAEAKTLPTGKIAVDPDVEELGNAAKTAGLTAGEIPTLKTKADELQGKLDAVDYEKTVETVAAANKLNDKFVELAKDKKLKFESKKEKDDDKNETEVWYVVQEKDGKTERQKLGEFLEKDNFFSKFADMFAAEDAGDGDGDPGESQGSGKKWVKQESGKKAKGTNEFDEIREEMKNQNTAKPTDNASVLAALSGQPVAPPPATAK
ncbi:MAG TPA: hypothetical protein VGC76_14555 [Pyrinomonadaceae bacterium]|jgi:hypothetical protein